MSETSDVDGSDSTTFDQFKETDHLVWLLSKKFMNNNS